MNQRDIKRALSEAVDKSDVTGPLFRTILDTADPKYLQQRSRELLIEASLSTKDSDTRRCLTLAITLMGALMVGVKKAEERKICNRKIKGGNCILPKGHEGAHQHGQADDQKQAGAGSQDPSGDRGVPNSAGLVREGDAR